MNRSAWPTSLCRRLWEALVDAEAGRRKSAVHEARWLNLLGFALRPGYGLAVDDWRVAETWRLVQGKLVHPSAAVRLEGWILWRRIGGGLLAGQQQALAEPLLGPVRGLHRLVVGGKGRGGDFGYQPNETAEIWRLLGSFELLPVALKVELGDILLDLLPKRKMETVRGAIVWAVGRLGARAPLYGPLNAVVPAETAAAWLKRLTDSFGGDPAGPLAVMQIARKTDDRYRDLSPKQRDLATAYCGRRTRRAISSRSSSAAEVSTARSRASSSAKHCRRGCEWRNLVEVAPPRLTAARWDAPRPMAASAWPAARPCSSDASPPKSRERPSTAPAPGRAFARSSRAYVRCRCSRCWFAP